MACRNIIRYEKWVKVDLRVSQDSESREVRVQIRPIVFPSHLREHDSIYAMCSLKIQQSIYPNVLMATPLKHWSNFPRAFAPSCLESGKNYVRFNEETTFEAVGPPWARYLRLKIFEGTYYANFVRTKLQLYDGR